MNVVFYHFIPFLTFVSLLETAEWPFRIVTQRADGKHWSFAHL
jgi:hypothetical protein